MAFQIINPATPTQTDKKRFGDDVIREFKSQVIAALQTISNYPNSAHTLTNIWTDATRPTENLKEGIFGWNSTKSRMEVYDGTAFLNASGRMVGEIVMWGGTEADIATVCNPQGFYLCNGQNGTVDLRDKFIVAAGTTRTHKSSGGADTHVHSTGDFSLGVNNLPNHFHFSSASPSDGTKAGSNLVNEKGDGEDTFAKYAAGSGCIGDAGDLYGQIGTDVAFRTGSMTTGGSAAAHNHGNTGSTSNVPVYYALCFIQKVS